MSKPYKVYFIDPELRTICEGTCRSLEDLQAAVGGLITIATEFENKDAVFVNDEGLFNVIKHWFSIDGALYQPFCGPAVIAGCDDEGETVDVKTSFDDFKKLIKFHTSEEVVDGTWLQAWKGAGVRYANTFFDPDGGSARFIPLE